MKKLILARGLPGAGKTTFATSIVSGRNGTVRAGDDYFYENGPTDGYDFDATKLGAAHKQCADRVEIDMINSVEMIVVTNTFTKARDMKNYIVMAEKWGYSVTSIIIENRHNNKSVHGVPVGTIDKMEKDLLNNIKLR